MKHTNSRILTAATAGLFLVAGITACSTNDAADAVGDATDAAGSKAAEATDAGSGDDAGDAGGDGAAEDAVAVNARPDECGLQEQEGPTASFGLFDAAVMYFQPGQMAENPNSEMKMLDYADSQMHIELDLKANAYATNWGYSVDETPANLTILYRLADAEGKEIDKGMMMPMNAIDGSHYGTNLAKDTVTEPGDYKLKITILPPKNYDIHSDYITGVPADEWFGPLSAEMDWTIEQENLDAIAANTVENPMEPSDECAEYPKTMFEDDTARENMEAAEAVEPLRMG
ncbi:iron transporter [Corynebacterium sphenisci]|uniref:iron transporter n=1 Tax=Corynebacterium sphenisci TaxID=191493 RepID=UPI0026DEA906|nr:iron transporter [Corynebacterium sphenisci]MDO5730146.1 iron transporter [Corynebacterium sphenisci]